MGRILHRSPVLVLPQVRRDVGLKGVTMFRDWDDVTVTENGDGTVSWEWKGDTGYALCSREVIEQLLTRLNAATEETP